MSDLARLAGVSKSTVSRALSGSERVTKATRERIQKLAQEHNYKLDTRARNLRKQDTLTIGVLLPSNGRQDWLATDPFILEMLGSVADSLEEKGSHELLLAKHTNNDPSWISEFARTRSVDGIIVIGQSLYHDELNKATDYHNAMVVWGAEIPGQKYITVGSDNYRGGRIATEHLLAQGRKNFAFLGDIRYPETRLRHQGYCDTLAQAGLEYRSELTTDSEHSSDAALQSLAELLNKPSAFDALIASSDLLAISAIKVITDHGLRVPEDIAIVGYDNITLANYSTPTLSSITQDRVSAGHLLVKKLFEILETGHSENSAIETELIVRGSSAVSEQV
ncbi:LacI family DNA-binding transcriptional regulator [Arenicella xantha]|nr:LacI family DNA-binding transcriptional regulator [Arenicella xantha]